MEDLIIILLGLAAAGYSAFRKNKQAKDARQSDSHKRGESENYAGQSGEDLETDRDYLEEFFGSEPRESGHQSHPYSEVNEGQERFKNPQLEDAYQQVRERERRIPGADSYYEQRSNFTGKQNNTLTNTKKYDNPPEAKSINEKQTRKLRKTRKQSVNQWFDLRRAVIYTEILNRKY